jgi:hypothetical protein
MARKPEEEIERLKREIPIERTVGGRVRDRTEADGGEPGGAVPVPQRPGAAADRDAGEESEGFGDGYAIPLPRIGDCVASPRNLSLARRARGDPGCLLLGQLLRGDEERVPDGGVGRRVGQIELLELVEAHALGERRGEDVDAAGGGVRAHHGST